MKLNTELLGRLGRAGRRAFSVVVAPVNVKTQHFVDKEFEEIENVFWKTIKFSFTS